MSIAPLDPIKGVRFEDLPDQAWPRQEIIDGSLHVTPFADLHHQFVVMRLCQALIVEAPDHLQVLPGANILRRRPESDRFLIPDVVVIDAQTVREGPIYLPPESVYLAAEVISPSSRATDLHLKKQLYMEWGIGAYWVLDHRSQTIDEFGPRDRSTGWLNRVDLSGIWPG